jgi:uncharacterized membrane protein YfhO
MDLQQKISFFTTFLIRNHWMKLFCFVQFAHLALSLDAPLQVPWNGASLSRVSRYKHRFLHIASTVISGCTAYFMQAIRRD